MPLSSHKNLGLALSGGGFRATLFHLGLLRALAETGQLSRVTHLTSVSGGSVLSAHLVLNWKAYADSSRAFARVVNRLDPADPAYQEGEKLFEEASQPLLELIEKDIRNRIIRRLPFNLLVSAISVLASSTIGIFCGKAFRARLLSFAKSRGLVRQLAHQLEGLFGRKKLRDLLQTEGPRLVILTTDVASMKLAWFTSDGFVRQEPGPPVGRDILSVAESVAASAAFPALFPPAVIDGKKFNMPLELDSFVTDAGVYDNLGISAFLGKPFAADSFPVYVSDATATSEWSSTTIPNLLTNLLRSVDVMQQRAAQLQRDKVGLPQRDARAGNAAEGLGTQSRFVLFDIARGEIHQEPKIGETSQRHVSYLRTDFDAFNSDEMRLVVGHGYAVACHTLKETGHLAPDTPCFFEHWRARWPKAIVPSRDDAKDADILRLGRRSRVRFFVLSDPVGVLNIILVVALLLLTPSAWVVEKHRRNAAEDELMRKTKLDGERRAQSRIDSFQNFSFSPKQPVTHETLPADVSVDSFEGLTISAFEKLFDLRSWRHVPAELRQREAIEPALQQTVYTIRRASNATSVAFRLKTSGVGIMPEIPTLDARIYQTMLDDERYPKHVLAKIDLSRIPPDMEYPVIVRGTFWNGFQKPIEDAGFKTYTNGDQGKMIILFPQNRIPRRFTFWQIVPGASGIELMATPPFHLFHKNGLYFEINRPQLNYTYGVQFTWTDEGTGPIDKVAPAYSPSLLAR